VSLRLTFVLVALAIILPFLAVVGYLTYAQISREKERVQDQALGRARAVGSQIETYLTSRVEALAAAAEAAAAGDSSQGSIDAQTRRLRQSFPDLGQVLVVDQIGTVLASTPPAVEGRRLILADQDWFKRAATSMQPFVGEPRFVGPDVVVGLFAPARAPDGQLRAVIAPELALRRVQDILSRAKLENDAVAEVLNERGVVVARQPALHLLKSVQALPGYPDILRRPESLGELTFQDQVRRLIGAVTIRPAGWVVVVGLPSAQVLADVKRIGTLAGGAALAATVLSLVLALVVSNRTTRGMARLRAAMSRLGGGDIPTNVPAGGGEVGALTEGFNQTLGWLRRRLQEYEALSRVEEAAGAALTGEGSVSAVLPDLLRRVVGGVGADVGAMVIQEGEGFVTKAAVGFGGVATEGVALRRGQGLVSAVVGSGQVVVVADVEADYRVEEPYLRAAGIHSVIGVPFLSQEAVIGAVEIGFRAPHTFTDSEIQRLETMARRTARALEHERVLEESRRNTQGLEAQLAEHMEALQRAAAEQAEARRQTQEAQRQANEARRQAQDLEQTIRMQVTREKEAARPDPAAEEAKRVRAAMQKTVNEELRVPLTALLDLPRFLVDGVDKPLGNEERQQLEILHARGEEVIELIDNLAILSALHANQVKVAKTPLSVPEVIQRVVRTLGPRAAAKGNRIETDIKGNVGQIVSDPKRLEQILANLLSTAIKYTEVGEIRVSAYLRDAELFLTVADDGVGFSAEEQARIFEPFLQVGPRNGRSLPGTGLVLTVCQRLVALIGAKIRVESEVDRGTWFTLSVAVQS